MTNNQVTVVEITQWGKGKSWSYLHCAIVVCDQPFRGVADGFHLPVMPVMTTVMRALCHYSTATLTALVVTDHSLGTDTRP